MNELAAAAGEFVLTMDSDLSHPAIFIERLWGERRNADLLIASRYILGASYRMPLFRTALSRMLNVAFSRGLDLRSPLSQPSTSAFASARWPPTEAGNMSRWRRAGSRTCRHG